MRRNIIETPALETLVEKTLASFPEPLQSWQACLRPVLLRHAMAHSRIVVARRRKSDPQWAQRAFARKERLFRMDERAMQRIARDHGHLTSKLTAVALIAKDCRHPMRQEAGRFFRSLRHWHPEPRQDDLYGLTFDFLDRACKAWCRARRHEPYTSARIIRQGALTGSRCRTVAEVMALGKEARNCLTHHHDIHMACLERQHDIWALRTDDRLVAVLRVRLQPELVAVELLGPRNHVGVAGHGHDLVQWIIAAGMKVYDGCHIRVADLMPKDMCRSRQDCDPFDTDGTLEMLFDL